MPPIPHASLHHVRPAQAHTKQSGKAAAWAHLASRCSAHFHSTSIRTTIGTHQPTIGTYRYPPCPGTGLTPEVPDVCLSTHRMSMRRHQQLGPHDCRCPCLRQRCTCVCTALSVHRSHPKTADCMQHGQQSSRQSMSAHFRGCESGPGYDEGPQGGIPQA